MYQYLLSKYHMHTYDIVTGMYMFIHPLVVNATKNHKSILMKYYITRQIPVVKASTDLTLKVSVRAGIGNLVDFGDCWGGKLL